MNELYDSQKKNLSKFSVVNTTIEKELYFFLNQALFPYYQKPDALKCTVSNYL